jgi:archaemetzincin
MKSVLAIVCIVMLQAGCNRSHEISLEHSNGYKTIALQPLGDYNKNQLVAVGREIATLFNAHVLILDPIGIPSTFHSVYDDTYSADSILQFLTRFVADTIVKIIGVTHKNIYVWRNFEPEQAGRLVNYHKTVFGLGLVGGDACVVSDYRLISNDERLFDNRLKKIMLHELGHNLGLSHCSVDTCIMSETNGDIGKLNKIGGVYCKRCREKLN